MATHIFICSELEEYSPKCAIHATQLLTVWLAIQVFYANVASSCYLQATGYGGFGKLTSF